MSAARLTGLSLLMVVCAIWTSGCDDKKPEPTVAPKPTQATSAAAASPKKPAAPRKPAAAAGALKWTKPDAWEKVDHPSPMRKGTFKIPKAEGDSEDAEMSITQVGGGVPANIKRWEGQFAEPDAAKTTEKTVNGLTVTVVEKSGTFNGMSMPGRPGAGPKKDWALLGAVVHTTPAHYFKMTGPIKTVQGSRPDFDKLVESFAPNK